MRDKTPNSNERFDTLGLTCFEVNEKAEWL